MTLPVVINPGDVGHIGDHVEIDELLARLGGQTDFLATGVMQDLLVNTPVAGASNLGLLRWVEDAPRLDYSDGAAWHQIVMATTSNVFTAINEFDDDIFFGSGRPWADIRHHSFAGGAVGDDVTDDTAAAQAAVMAMEALGGGTVYTPPAQTGKTYRIAGVVTEGFPVCFVGEGRASHWKSLAATQRCIQVGTTDGSRTSNTPGIGTNTRTAGVVVHRMHFEQITPHADDDHAAITVYASDGCRVIDCDFTSCSSGVTITHGGLGLSDRRSTDGIVAFCRMTDMDRLNIELFHTLRCIAACNQMSSTAYHAASKGVRVNASEDTTLLLNIMVKQSIGISIQSSDYLTVNFFNSRVTVIHNKVVDSGVDAIQATDDARSVLIAENTIRGWGMNSAFVSYGIGLTNPHAAPNVPPLNGWSNAQIYRNIIDCTNSDATDVPIHLDHGSHARIVGNEVSNIIDGQSACLLDSCGGVIGHHSNTYIAATGAANTATGKFSHTGSLAGAATASLGNYFIGPMSVAFSVPNQKNSGSGAGVFTRKNNYNIDTNLYMDLAGTRWIARNFGLTTVANAASIAHGLSSAPTVVLVSATVDGDIVGYNSPDATKFFVTIRHHDGAVGATQLVAWEAKIE